MACGCNKGKTDSQAARTQRAQDNAARRQPEPAPQMQGARARTVPVMQGGQQSFSLQSGDKTARFGSALERDAAQARLRSRV
ncbi:hypothetical protein SEA_NICOLE72_21 [Microbacterium phage Nicole72]|uniref:Uncharacterized protein n=1 Tax=Microbacterium phage Nicole72 TaxID=3062838 RepID=A0ACD4UHI0_9CAUD|nr:hypothetical protein SEA_NICOLE72_21 [Microbacterium phage Nicole72]